MKKKFAGLFLVFVFVFSSIMATQASGSEQRITHGSVCQEEQVAIDAEIDAIHGDNFSANRRIAMSQFDLIEEGFIHARDGSIIYPDFYGGMALDSDGMPIIFIVESRLEDAYSHDTIGTLLEAGLRYELVEISHDELLAISDKISAITAERYLVYQCVYSYNLSFISTDIRNNWVVVALVEYNEHMIEGFKRYVYDSPVLMFRQGDRFCLGEGQGNATFCNNDVDWNYSNSNWSYMSYPESIVPFNATLNTGVLVRRRYLTGGGSYGTVGFRVQCARTGARGFLTTAGDVFGRGQDVIERGVGGRQIGTVRESIFRHGAGTTGMNASFVALTGSNEVTNRLPNGGYLRPSQGSTTPRVGDWVHAFGGTTNREVTGQITDTNVTLTNAGRRLYRMTLVERGASSQSGNSGGPVYFTDGLHVGLISGGDANHLFVVPMYRILNDFRSLGFDLRRW